MPGRDYPDWLRAAGFVVRLLAYANRFDLATQRRHGLLPSDFLLVCRHS